MIVRSKATESTVAFAAPSCAEIARSLRIAAKTR